MPHMKEITEMKKQIVWTKLSVIITISVLTMLIISIGINGYLGICLARMQQKSERKAQEEEALSRMYLNQNIAFCLPKYEMYLPYSELGNTDRERQLYKMIQYYNYSTDSHLSLGDIYDFLSSPMDRFGLKNYEDYPEIKAYIEFELELVYSDFIIPEGDRARLYEKYRFMLDELKKEHPEFETYTTTTVPFELVNEIMHKIVNPSYEMDLEITDERNYGYIAPEILEFGHGNTY